MRVRRMVAAVAAGTAAVGVSASAAAAQDFGPDHRTTTGGDATCSAFTYQTYHADDTAEIDCSLTDTQADGNAPYVAWWQDGFGQVHIYNHDGNGNTIYFYDIRNNPGGAFADLYWKVCRDRGTFLPDNCSSTVHYHIGSA